MQSLRDLQREFGSSLLALGGVATPHPGLRIYTGNVYGNWTKALACAYPVARKIVGGRFFEALACAYARTHPSTSGDLNELGEHFPAFVAGFPDTQDLPYLSDVARMEWLAHRAHFAADMPRLDPARLAGMAPEEYQALPLRRAPASALMISGWPLARLWAVHQDDYRGDPAVDLAAGFERILICRPRWRTQVESIDAGDYRLLAEAGRGAALGGALYATADAVPGFDAAAALSRWVARGIVAL